MRDSPHGTPRAHGREGKAATEGSAKFYTKLAVLGKGSYGQVRKGMAQGGMAVAIKVFHSGSTGNVEALEARSGNPDSR